MPRVTKTIEAENVFSDPLEVGGHFDLSISGTFSATVTVQRSFDNGGVWSDVDTFTSAIETFGFNPGSCLYRAGVKTGDYVSGTIVVFLYDGDLSK